MEGWGETARRIIRENQEQIDRAAAYAASAAIFIYRPLDVQAATIEIPRTFTTLIHQAVRESCETDFQPVEVRDVHGTAIINVQALPTPGDGAPEGLQLRVSIQVADERLAL